MPKIHTNAIYQVTDKHGARLPRYVKTSHIVQACDEVPGAAPGDVLTVVVRDETCPTWESKEYTARPDELVEPDMYPAHRLYPSDWLNKTNQPESAIYPEALKTIQVFLDANPGALEALFEWAADRGREEAGETQAECCNTEKCEPCDPAIQSVVTAGLDPSKEVDQVVGAVAALLKGYFGGLFLVSLLTWLKNKLRERVHSNNPPHPTAFKTTLSTLSQNAGRIGSIMDLRRQGFNLHASAASVTWESRESVTESTQFGDFDFQVETEIEGSSLTPWRVVVTLPETCVFDSTGTNSVEKYFGTEDGAREFLADLRHQLASGCCARTRGNRFRIGSLGMCRFDDAEVVAAAAFTDPAGVAWVASMLQDPDLERLAGHTWRGDADVVMRVSNTGDGLGLMFCLGEFAGLSVEAAHEFCKNAGLAVDASADSADVMGVDPETSVVVVFELNDGPEATGEIHVMVPAWHDDRDEEDKAAGDAVDALVASVFAAYDRLGVSRHYAGAEDAGDKEANASADCPEQVRVETKLGSFVYEVCWAPAGNGNPDKTWYVRVWTPDNEVLWAGTHSRLWESPRMRREVFLGSAKSAAFSREEACELRKKMAEDLKRSGLKLSGADAQVGYEVPGIGYLLNYRSDAESNTTRVVDVASLWSTPVTAFSVDVHEEHGAELGALVDGEKVVAYASWEAIAEVLTNTDFLGLPVAVAGRGGFAVGGGRVKVGSEIVAVSKAEEWRREEAEAIASAAQAGLDMQAIAGIIDQAEKVEDPIVCDTSIGAFSVRLVGLASNDGGLVWHSLVSAPHGWAFRVGDKTTAREWLSKGGDRVFAEQKLAAIIYGWESNGNDTWTSPVPAKHGTRMATSFSICGEVQHAVEPQEADAASLIASGVRKAGKYGKRVA